MDPWRNAGVFWLSLAGPGQAVAIACGHELEGPPNQLGPGEVFEILRPLFFSDRLKIGHNVKFDVLCASRYYGELVPGPYGNTKIPAHLLKEDRPLVKGTNGAFSLEALLKTEFGFTYEKLGRKGPDRFPFEEAGRYSWYDARYSWLLWRHLTRRLEREDEGIREIFAMEQRLTDVLLRMEYEGSYVDRKAVDKLAKKITGMMETLEQKIFSEVGREFRLTANADKIEVFYGKKEEGGLGLKPRNWTAKTGDPSLSKGDLEFFSQKHPVISWYLEWQSLRTLRSTFVEGGIRKKLHPDGRLRTSYDQVGTVTGRLSSSKPNLQNIPRDATSALAGSIRAAFVAPQGCKLIVADWSQIELRVLAHYCRDPKLMAAYNRTDVDLHTDTARFLFQTEDITSAQRSLAKTLNFGVAYGASPERVKSEAAKNDLRISMDEAIEICERLDDLYPSIPRWKKKLIREAKKHKAPTGRPDPHVRTLFGRKRRLPELLSQNGRLRSRAERQAANVQIQGTAADMMKVAMLRIDEHLSLPEHSKKKMVLTVHDEVMLIVPEAEADEAVEIVRQSMEIPGILSVPIKADITVCDRWSEKK